MSDAIGYWSDQTDFNPVWDGSNGTSANRVYVDVDSVPWCPHSGFQVAIVCKNYTVVYDQFGEVSYYDLWEQDVFLNEALYVFNFTNEGPPSGSGSYDAEGIFTHESGHLVRLVDLSCFPGPTMCNTVESPEDTYLLRSLWIDDCKGANYNSLPTGPADDTCH